MRLNFSLKTHEARHKRDRYKRKIYNLNLIVFSLFLAFALYLSARPNLINSELLLTLMTPFLWALGLNYVFSPFAEEMSRGFHTRRKILSSISTAGMLSIFLTVTYSIFSWFLFHFDNTYSAYTLDKSLTFTVTNSYGKESAQDTETFEWINPEYNKSEIRIDVKNIENPLISQSMKEIALELKLPPCSSGLSFNLFDGEKTEKILLSPEKPSIILTEIIEPNDSKEFVVSDFSETCTVEGDNREFALGVWEPKIVP
jgi:hypothetical protein